MQCDEFAGLLEEYLDETLEGDRRAELRGHLASCDTCRSRALEREPTLVLTLAERREPAPVRVDQCVTAVMAQVRQERIGHELRRPRPTWWMAAAAAVVVAVAGAVMWQTSDQVSAPVAVSPPALAETAADEIPPRIEIDMPGEGVRVYHQYADGDGGDNAAVYFVVNPALES